MERLKEKGREIIKIQINLKLKSHDEILKSQIVPQAPDQTGPPKIILNVKLHRPYFFKPG